MPPQHPAPYQIGDHVQYRNIFGEMKSGYIRNIVTTNTIPQQRYYMIVENQNDLNNPAVIPFTINYVFVEEQQQQQVAAVGGRRRKSRRAARKSRRSGRKAGRSTRRR